TCMRTRLIIADELALFAARWFSTPRPGRVNRKRYQTRAEARSDVFDYIERFHNPRRARRTEQRKMKELA
ncbi:MAG: hypothetical protein OSA88_12150, partial [Acidimicrobiales bacterium]|nr:hypothetical protein [Acidimicrobiales bacterium]